MALIKVKEVIGSSVISFEDAINEIVKEFCSHKKNVTGIKVLSQSVKVENDKVIEYKVNASVAYLWNKDIHVD